jgi:glucokinase
VVNKNGNGGDWASDGEAVILGIDIGGTQIKSASLRPSDGECLHRETADTRAGEMDEAGIPVFVSAVQKLVDLHEKATGKCARRIGISAPGLVNSEGSAIAFMPGRMGGLENLLWRDALSRKDEVPVLNDAHAALMGEFWQGAARGLQDVFMLTLGTGVGGAIISGGRLMKGHRGRAGHVGHVTVDFRGIGDICGTPGSIEDAIGNHTIEQRSGGRYESTHQLVDDYVHGDEEAKEIWITSVRGLAAMIASMTNVLDPQAVIIGGGIGEAGAPLLDPLNDFLDRFEWRPAGARVEIREAKLGTWAGAYGAAYNAMTTHS